MHKKIKNPRKVGKVSLINGYMNVFLIILDQPFLISYTVLEYS